MASVLHILMLIMHFGCVVVCVSILTRLWPNRYYIYLFQVLIDSPLPRVESVEMVDEGRLSYVLFWDSSVYDLTGSLFGNCN